MGAQDFAPQLRLGLVKGRVRGFIKIALLLEVVVVVMEAVLSVEAVAAVTLLAGVQIRPDERSNIPFLSAVDVAHMPQSVCANDEASTNMSSMLVTLETSHLEISSLKEDA